MVRFSNSFIFGPQLAFSLWSVFPITSFPDHNLLFPCGPIFQSLHFRTTTCFFPLVRFSNHFIFGPLLIQNLWSEIKETRKSDHASTSQASNSADTFISTVSLIITCIALGYALAQKNPLTKLVYSCKLKLSLQV